MPLSKAKLVSNNRYLAAHYEQINIKTRKDERIRERIAIAARRKGTTPRGYILTAIVNALEADGVTDDVYE